MAIWNVRKADAKPANAPAFPEKAPVQVGAAGGGATARPLQDRVRERNLGLKVSIHRALLDRINLAALEQHAREQIESEIKLIVSELLEERREMLNAGERNRLVEEVLDELLRLGPLEPLRKDKAI